jgi:hypothetical protein
MGERGPTGAKGENGIAGVAGAKGAKGDRGSTGAKGATGERGATGATGEPGTASDTGATGATGATGLQGERGATGAKGENGLPGVAGARGATGATGSPGATGATGATGSPGTTGSPGVNGSGGISDILSAYNLSGGRLNFNRGTLLVPFPDTSLNTSYLTNPARTVFTIPEDGIYYIKYDVYTTKQVNMETTILRDGNPLSGTGNSYSINDYHFSGSIITPLESGDIISLRLSDNNDSYVTLNDDIGASLDMYKIADASILRNNVEPRTMNTDIVIDPVPAPCPCPCPCPPPCC